MYETYNDRVEFVLVEVRNAGHEVPGLEFVWHRGQGAAERRALLSLALEITGLAMLTVVDNEDAEVAKAYAAWPERLFVVNSAGTIALDAGCGIPKGWNYQRVQACLDEELRPNEAAPS